MGIVFNTRRRDSVCLCVTEPEGAWEGGAFVRQVLFSPAAVWQMVNNFQPRDCMCSALFLFKSETQLYPSEIFQTSADCLEF